MDVIYVCVCYISYISLRIALLFGCIDIVYMYCSMTHYYQVSDLPSIIKGLFSPFIFFHSALSNQLFSSRFRSILFNTPSTNNDKVRSYIGNIIAVGNAIKKRVQATSSTSVQVFVK